MSYADLKYGDVVGFIAQTPTSYNIIKGVYLGVKGGKQLVRLSSTQTCLVDRCWKKYNLLGIKG